MKPPQWKHSGDMVTTSNDVKLRISQGYRDAREWRRFLVEHKKGNYRVLADMDDFAVVDVMQVTPEGKCQHVELKSRKHPLGQYPDCQVDESKIRHLQQLHAETGEKTYLAALYPLSGKVAIWEITEEDDYKTIERFANATTVQQGLSVKKPKRMVSLPLKDAKVYRHKFE